MHCIIVGLGNPGDQYEKTRHNVGFMVLDELGKKQVWSESRGAQALYAHIKTGNNTVELIKPHTFMNKSGSAVLYAKKKHKIKPENIIVVHDDVDLPFGTLKIIQGRGSGGHRGVESIISSLGTKNFIRVRVGVVPTTPTGKLKKPKGDSKVLDHLMGPFSRKEDKELSHIIKHSAEATAVIIANGVQVAMNKYN